MTVAERAELERLRIALRKIAEPIGPLHGTWDVILDIEAALASREMLITQSPATLIAVADSWIDGGRGTRGSGLTK